jgi:hypothetical protein
MQVEAGNLRKSIAEAASVIDKTFADQHVRAPTFCR